MHVVDASQLYILYISFDEKSRKITCFFTEDFWKKKIAVETAILR
jgi:hypothetical protein